jgi:hypothetical protein
MAFVGAIPAAVFERKDLAMKRFLALLAASLIAAPAFAEDTAPAQPASPTAANEALQQMTPEQKQVMKEQAKTTAQQKQAAWQQMSPEEKQAKRDAMHSRMQERATQFRASRRH